MNRITLFLLALLALSGAYIYFGEYEAERNKSIEELKAKKVFSFIPGDIGKIEIIKGGTPQPYHIHLHRAKGNRSWHIEKPIEEKADNEAVEKFLLNLAQLSMDDSFIPTTMTLAPYGLLAPTEEIVLTKTEGETPSLKLKVGGMNVLSDRFYAQRDNEKQILLLPAFEKAGIEPTLFSFRVKKLLQFSEKDLTQLIIKRTVKGVRPLSLSLSKKGENWEATSFGTTSESDIDAVHELISLLSSLEASSFVDHISGKKEKELFAENRRTEVSLITQNDPHPIRLLISTKTEDGNFYAKREGASKVALIPPPLPRLLTKRGEQLRQHRFFTVEQEDIRSFSIKTGTKGWDVRREGRKWNIQDMKGEKKKSNEMELIPLLKAIQNLAIYSYALMPYGKEPEKAFLVELTSKRGTKKVQFYAHHENEKLIYCTLSPKKKKWYRLKEGNAKQLLALLPLLEKAP